jgi:cyclic beta-1,2-glucan synthetase
VSEAQGLLSYEAEWLLDNFYVVQQTVRQIRESMPKGYYRRLPKLESSPMAGYPRVFALALAIIECDQEPALSLSQEPALSLSQGRLDMERVARFVRAYQRVTPLTMGELWALPTMLRLGVLELLAQTVGRDVDTQIHRDKHASTGVSLPEGLAGETIVARCMLNLHTLAAQDWKAFFEDVSLVEKTLRSDPVGIYARMDFDTRDRYRKVVEELALATEQEEIAVASAAVGLAQEHLPEMKALSLYSLPRTAHVGFYLLDAGRHQLETRLGYRPTWSVRLRRWLFDHPTPVYLGGIAMLTLVALIGVVEYAFVAGGRPAQLIGAALLSLLPVTTVAVSLVNWLVMRTVPPRVLPKMDFRAGIPAECSTMVVVPAFLTTVGEIEFLLRQLEQHFLSNVDPHMHFALLTDFADAPEKHRPEDNVLLEQAKRGIQALNRKYGQTGPGSFDGLRAGPFYLFHRDRQWNASENTWMGWERKRGKLVEFNRLVGGSTETSFTTQFGDLDILTGIQYVITLDTDTTLPRDSAHRLVATLAHPLNRAEFDPASGAVVAGYTVLQPRTEVKLTSANRSLFTRIFTGDTGLDLYTRAVSDVYQDLFGEGIYVGKGIYDIVAFTRSLAGRVPDNALLSHDLFEGIYGRAGLVTDVILYEDYPPGYLTYARRLHRWVRGDWQLLPWLFPRVPRTGAGTLPHELSAIDRWKILDNLRRSLHAPALLALLIAGWVWLPGSALAWTLAVLVFSAMPRATGVVTGLAQKLRNTSLNGITPPLRAETARWLLALVFLPYEAVLVVGAIGTTLVRLTIRHRRLLQWTTAAHTIRLFGKERKVALAWKQMGSAPLLALGAAVLVGVVNLPALPVAVPLLAAWLVSPLVAHWISKPTAYEQAPLSAEQRQQLRHLARRTWLYFEQFVGPDDHWLPPDHFQENPLGQVAHRTSPTNLGLLLLSTLAACELGYIGSLDLSVRLGATFESMDTLERYRGHLLNWYDTRSMKSLSPRYVSTVDSGNLAGCLLALKQGLQSLPQKPILGWQRWQGWLDTMDVLVEIVEGLEGDEIEQAAASLRAHLAHVRQQVADVQDTPARWMSLLTPLGGEGWQELNRLLVALVESSAHVLDAVTLRGLRLWSERMYRHFYSMWDELDLLLPWLAALSQPPALLGQAEAAPAIRDAWQTLQDALPAMPRLTEVPGICRAGRACLDRMQDLLVDEAGPTELVQEGRTWCERLAEKLDAARATAEGCLTDLQDLSTRAEAYFQAMDFTFLFEPRQQVFHLGYDMAAGKLDSNYYDLLASEARTASIVAIAKGDVPQSHWLHLNRPLCQVDGMRALLSWNGSMFEYLMPGLLMRSYAGTLLDQTQRAVVHRQIAYARQKGVAWGISESGYYHFDANENYQYRGFGVPGLGCKRGLGEDLVIAPYASLIALPVQPQAVAQNVAGLIERQMLGHYGFYEAIDYTPSRLPLGHKSAVVQSYMAHHQGMILVALTNYLQGEAIVRLFHADPRVRSVELLLQEQVPQQAPVEEIPEESIGLRRQVQARIELEPWRPPTDAALPQAHLLSNGHYGVLITSSGGGYSRWQQVDLTRWHADTTLDDWGTWIYVQDRASGALWSAAYQPSGAPPEEQEVLFYAHKAEFRRRDHDISLRMEIAVAPNDDVEIRRMTMTNHSDHPRRLALTSYSEVTLAPQTVDRRHPAFNKLFIESEYVPELNALLLHRRLRSAEEKPIYLAHLAVVEKEDERSAAHESDRARFLGRGRTARSPAALSPSTISSTGRDARGRGLSGTTGAVLDPLVALGQELELEPHAEAHIVYVTLAAPSREEALGLARRYRTIQAIDQAFDQARSQSETELRNLGLDTHAVEQIQQLLSALLYPYAALRATPETLAANSKGQSGLWPSAISGDYPILLVGVGNKEEIALVRELLQAHAYSRNRQMQVDLVILNEQDTGYAQELHDQLNRVIAQTDNEAWLNRRGGIFVLRAGQMSEAERVLLKTAARVVLDGGKGRLAEQLRILRERPLHLPHFVPTQPSPDEAGWKACPTDEAGWKACPDDVEPTPLLARPADLLFENGVGGFSADGREYVIYLEPGQWTPAPWINVVANPGFGFLASEAGGGYTWAGNSSENRLTPWHNDPVADTPGEALYLRDEETAAVWSPTPLPARAPAPYLIRHGAGYSAFEHHSHGLKQRLRLFAAPDAPVKVIQLQLENTWHHTRRITATFYVEWVLGTERDITQQYVVPEFVAASNALLATNPYNEEFGERVAFVAASKELHGLTADRTEFLGREGTRTRPAALERIGLAGAVKPGLDPCAALQVHLNLAPGEVQEVFFLLGQGVDRKDALRLIEQYQDAAQVNASWEAVNKLWDDLLGAVTVETPDAAMNLLLNRWLLYQALACRVWGRSALYQSSGAFGYRDQLQDVMALVHAAPEIAREHILRAAGHQFEAGDVLHWWHHPPLPPPQAGGRGGLPPPQAGGRGGLTPPQAGGRRRGVRTRCSDDLLWLPFVTAHYVAATGDVAILTEQVPFLTGEPLEAGEEERYGHYESAAEQGTLYEHCRRALDKGSTAGAHGLPLMGSGDWNDGMNRVGSEGRGESVWLGWFLYATLTRFASLCEHKDDEGQATAYRQRAQDLRQALEQHAWDGNWYRRAYYDDGTPLGSAENLECQIDSIAQSWAAISGAADPARAVSAMEAVADRLVCSDDQLVLLFAPPFDKTMHDPGYIKGYPPGIRENGGQYTHAALWATWAFAELGQGERAEALFRLLNPIYHSDTPAKAARYRVEPYVVAADVYSGEPHVGQGGWTWYTGAAGWMYRLGLEAILGLRRRGNSLQINPCIPRGWPGYALTYRNGGTVYHIRVENPGGVNRGVKQATLDGDSLPDKEIPLLDDGQQHEVRILMG